MSRLDELRGRIESREAAIGVIGLGYVGLPLAIAFAKAGFEVSARRLISTSARNCAESFFSRE